MSWDRRTHADCMHAQTAVYDEWYDKFGNPHQMEIIRCTGGCNDGRCFSARDPMPRDCKTQIESATWEEVVARQAAESAA